MAKLGSYYGLCPLIDHRSLLGINEDVDAGQVVVTLGKNIAIKYKLLDQKQLNSWRTKDKFTSPIIYDKQLSKYVAVFNQTFIRMWNDDVEYLDKLKKYKFSKPIFTLLSYKDKTFVVFQNGAILLLNSALQERKSVVEDVINTNVDYIIDVIPASINSVLYVGLLFSSNGEFCFMWNTFFEDSFKNSNKIIINKPHPNLSLTGQVLCQRGNTVQLFTLWSNGKLYCFPLRENETLGKVLEPPGELYAVIDSLYCENPVTMVALNQHYIAMYGGDRNQEGALLIIYNVEFKVIQTKQTFKLFSSGAKLWRIESSLLLSVGQNLAVVPFHLETEQLSALVGSHATIPTEESDMIVVQELEVANWDNKTNFNDKSELIPSGIRSHVEELLVQGWSETMMCEYLIPKFIENKDVNSISSCLEYFCDVPEHCIVTVLKFCLSVNSNVFKNLLLVDSNISDIFSVPLKRCRLLETILALSFSDALLLPHLRSDLNLNESLILIQYLAHLMYDGNSVISSLDIINSTHKLIQWSCLLLDANYQKLLLSQDKTILTVLVKFRELVSNYLLDLQDLNSLFPIVNQFMRKKSMKMNKQAASFNYNVERVNLYS